MIGRVEVTADEFNVDGEFKSIGQATISHETGSVRQSTAIKEVSEIVRRDLTDELAMNRAWLRRVGEKCSSVLNYP